MLTITELYLVGFNKKHTTSPPNYSKTFVIALAMSWQWHISPNQICCICHLHSNYVTVLLAGYKTIRSGSTNSLMHWKGLPLLFCPGTVIWIWMGRWILLLRGSLIPKVPIWCQTCLQKPNLTPGWARTDTHTHTQKGLGLIYWFYCSMLFVVPK